MDRAEFLARRKSGIGGSDVAAIIGISPWRTPRDIYLDKKGLSEPEPETDAMYWGTTLEDIVAREYSKRSGRRIERCNQMFKHPEHAFLVGNVDRVVWGEDGKRPVVGGKLITDRILECKTASQYAAQDWGEPGTDEIPEYYKAQVMWYMGITGAQVCDVAVLIGNRDFRMYTVDRDDSVIQYLFAEGIAFWTEYVEKDIMPPARTLEDVESVCHGEAKARKFADDLTIDAVKTYAELDTKIKEFKAEQDKLKIQICDAIGDAVELVAPDATKLCSWTAAKPQAKTDWKAVAEDLGADTDTIRKHTTEIMTARRFTLAARKCKTEKSDDYYIPYDARALQEID